MASVIITSKDVFDKEVKEYSGLAVVDFWAEWCGPCKMLNPILDELENTFKDKIKFIKLNVDDNEEISTDFNVQSIPTIIVFKNGIEVERFVGVRSKEDYVNAFNKL